MRRKMPTLVVCLAAFFVVHFVNHLKIARADFEEAVATGIAPRHLMEALGQAAKSVVYAGAAAIRVSGKVLCPTLNADVVFVGTNKSPNIQTTNNLLDETDTDASVGSPESPTLFVFTSRLLKDRAFRIYSDDELTEELFEESKLDANQMTYIFVHGWMGGIQQERWLSAAKDATLFSSVDSDASNSSNNNNWQEELFKPNVIVVDWSELSRGSIFNATQNSIQVAKRLAKQLKALVTIGKLNPTLMHCLGHSLGAHICGQAARIAFGDSGDTSDESASSISEFANTKKLGRITGLDPGGFCYERGARDELNYAGLKPTDAKLVDAFYTNRSPFGNRFNVAQINVHVNGAVRQQSCDVWLNPEAARQYLRAILGFVSGGDTNNEQIACDHYFATKLATTATTITMSSSTKRHCSHVGVACSSYRDFIRGKCACNSSQDCFSMDFEYQRGVLASTAHARAKIEDATHFLASVGNNQVLYERRRVLHLRSRSEPPYCSYSFRVRVELADWLSASQASIKSRWLRLKLRSIAGLIRIMNGGHDERADYVELNGPFDLSSNSKKNQLTALIELAAPYESVLDDKEPFISVDVLCARALFQLQQQRRRSNSSEIASTSILSPVEAIHLDYISGATESDRLRFSRTLTGSKINIMFGSIED